MEKSSELGSAGALSEIATPVQCDMPTRAKPEMIPESHCDATPHLDAIGKLIPRATDELLAKPNVGGGRATGCTHF